MGQRWLRHDKHKQAGLTYLGGGLLVLLFTFLTQLVPQSRAAEAFLLFPGVFFVLLFARLVYLGPGEQPVFAPSRPWPSRFFPLLISLVRRWAVRVLALTNAGRTALFLSNAVGQNIHLTVSPPRLFVVSSDAEPLFLVNALLMALITFMLVRAGWDLPPGKTVREPTTRMHSLKVVSRKRGVLSAASSESFVRRVRDQPLV